MTTEHFVPRLDSDPTQQQIGSRLVREMLAAGGELSRTDRRTIIESDAATVPQLGALRRIAKHGLRGMVVLPAPDGFPISLERAARLRAAED